MFLSPYFDDFKRAISFEPPVMTYNETRNSDRGFVLL